MKSLDLEAPCIAWHTPLRANAARTRTTPRTASRADRIAGILGWTLAVVVLVAAVLALKYGGVLRMAWEARELRIAREAVELHVAPPHAPEVPSAATGTAR